MRSRKPYVPTTAEEYLEAQKTGGVAASWAGGKDGLEVLVSLLKQLAKVGVVREARKTRVVLPTGGALQQSLAAGEGDLGGVPSRERGEGGGDAQQLRRETGCDSDKGELKF